MPSVGIHLLVVDEMNQRIVESGSSPLHIARARKMEAHSDFTALGAVGPDLLYYTGLKPKLVGVLPSVFAWLHRAEEILEKAGQLAEGAAMPNLSQRINQLAQVADTFLTTSESALIHGLTELFSIISGDLFQPSPIQEDEHEDEWNWGDLLHWRFTGRLADALDKRALILGDARLQAYASAYWTHLACDFVGHPYVNEVVGGPGRGFTMRHHLAENFMDTAAYAERGRDISNERVNERMESLEGSGIDDVSKLLAESIRDLASRWPTVAHRLPDLPDASDIQEAFGSMQTLFGYVTKTNFVAPPVRPSIQIPPLPGAHDSLTQRFIASRAPRDFKFRLKDLLKALIFLIALTVVIVADIARFAVDLAIGGITYPPAALLYHLQTILYSLYRKVRWFLVTSGVLFPSPDELSSSLGKQFVPLQHPSQSDGAYFSFPKVPDYAKPFTEDWTIEGRRFHIFGKSTDYLNFPGPGVPSEHPTTVPSVYPSGVTPDYFIGQAAADGAFLNEWRNASNPSEIVEACRKQLMRGTSAGVGFGNAIDLTMQMYDNPGTFYDINLDGDRGYGSKNWTFDNGIKSGSVSGERFFRW